MTELAKLTVSHKETRLSFRADMFASDEVCLHAVSAVGSGTAIRAMAAGLRSREPVRFYSKLIGYGSVTSAEKYRFRYAKLAFDLWQIVAISTNPQFMLKMDVPAMWRLLSSDTFTTPILKEWMPWIMDTMKNERRLLRSMKR